jgi:hypothetical protein
MIETIKPPMPVVFELAGTTWQCLPLGLDEQFELECILLCTFGPAAGAAIAALVEGVTPALVDVLRDATGAGDSFDLSKLMSRPAATEKLREHWLAALDMLRKATQRTGSSVAAVLACEGVGPTGAHWEAVVAELERLTEDAEDPGEVDYADPELQTAWGELLGGLVVALHETIGRGEAFDVARVLPLDGDAGPSWLALLGASLAEVVRETAGRGTFDLAGLMRLDTTDPRLRDAWESLLGSLAGTVGDLVRGAIYALAGRLAVADVKRLFELCVLGKKVMVPKFGNGWVTSYEVLNGILRHDPRAKWDLLVQCLLVTYSRGPAAEVGDE